MASCSTIDYPRRAMNNRVYNTMIEDTFPAAEKILSDIENVIKKDPLLVSFEMIPAEDNENKSPVFHEEHSLGLASWCVQPLYCYAYNRLLDLRHNKHKREEPSNIARWLLGALLLNPDVSTFWNMRRELVKNNRLDPLKEFHFINIVQSHSPKCFDAFAYRRWLVQLILLQNKHSCNVDVVLILKNEIDCAAMAAQRYANNCHAWSHRQHIIATLEDVAPTQLRNILLQEWDKTAKWCETHISDYSGFVYRQFLLKKLLLFENSCSSSDPISEDYLAKRRQIILNFVKSGDRMILDGCSSGEMLDILHGQSQMQPKNLNYDQILVNLSYWTEECLLNKDLIDVYPRQEALWYHRRFLLNSLRALSHSYNKFRTYRGDFFEPPACWKLMDQDKNRTSKLLQAFNFLFE